MPRDVDDDEPYNGEDDWGDDPWHWTNWGWTEGRGWHRVNNGLGFPINPGTAEPEVQTPVCAIFWFLVSLSLGYIVYLQGTRQCGPGP